MDGILVIDKPAGITSHDVVARVRRILRTKRVGHTGTLDPFATGVMVLMIGKATRLARFLDTNEKAYDAVIRLGFETDTADLTGERLPTRELPTDELRSRSAAIDWEKIFEEFRGEIEQVPPMYSAKKVEGKKLYELARKGVEIERKANKVNIYHLDRHSTAPDQNDQDKLGITVVCSAGTYIRTLAEDIGKRCTLGAHLIALRRTRSGRFANSDAITLDDLAELDDPVSRLLPMTTAVDTLAALDLNSERVTKTLSGLSTRLHDAQYADGEWVKMIDAQGALVAVGIFSEAERCVQPKIVLV